MLQAVAHLGDGQRGGVGGKHSLRLAQRIQLGEQGALGLHFLLDAFDDQVCIGRSSFFLHQNAAQQVLLGFLGHLALGHALGQRSSQLILMPLGRRQTAGIHQRNVTVGCKDLGDTAAHGAGSENRYLHVVILLFYNLSGEPVFCRYRLQ